METYPSKTAESHLFKPLSLGGGLLTLKHRVVMAPLTRCRAGHGEAPTDLNAEYYEQRASDGGLIIGEASQISQNAMGFAKSPGCFTVSQLEGWAMIIDGIHKRNGLFFMQIWHGGRCSTPEYQVGGTQPLSASNLFLEGDDIFGRPHQEPRALTVEEIKGQVQDFALAAKNSVTYGADGIEIHGANGYLVEQFLSNTSNDRTDEYGGSIDNRCRFALEVIDACVEAVGDSRRVAIRLSPFNVFQMEPDSESIALFTHILEELNSRNLAYVNIIEPRGHQNPFGLETPTDVTRMFRKAYKGVLFTASGYDCISGEAVIEEGTADAVVYGRHFIANPDLPFRFKNGLELNKYDRSSFYYGTEVGYTDYPFHPKNPRLKEEKNSPTPSCLGKN